MKLFLKKSFQVFFIICSLLSLILQVEAHSGRTDSNGGHYNRSDGSYHYHHGYSAHQHKNGVYPYEFDDKTDYGANSGNIDIDEKSSISTTDLEDDINSVAFWDVFAAMLMALFPTCAVAIFVFSGVSPICFLVFREEKGWLITLVVSAILTLSFYIWLVIQFL